MEGSSYQECPRIGGRLTVLIDLHSRRVVGWSTSSWNDRHLALDALAKARQSRRPGPGIIVHSDRGSPYASDDYRAALRAMVDLLSRRHGMSPVEAYMLCSVCADLRISEIVDMPNWLVSLYFPRVVLE